MDLVDSLLFEFEFEYENNYQEDDNLNINNTIQDEFTNFTNYISNIDLNDIDTLDHIMFEYFLEENSTISNTELNKILTNIAKYNLNIEEMDDLNNILNNIDSDFDMN